MFLSLKQKLPFIVKAFSEHTKAIIGKEKKFNDKYQTVSF